MGLVYHLMPKNLIGDTLYPLNRLQEIYPEIYKQQVRKYEGREALLEQRIPVLNCLWNDVLFFSPVHPRAIQAAFSTIGKPWISAQWIEIETDLYHFDDTNTVIYDSNMERAKGDFTIDSAEIGRFHASKLTTLDAIPQATLEYYRRAVEQNEPIMVWRGITHVLHRGDVSLAQANIFAL